MNAKTLLPLVALAMVGWGRPAMYTLAQDAAAPADPGASAPSASPPTVHLLANNQLVFGRLVEENDRYVIEQRSASNPGQTAQFRFAKDQVVASYANMEAFYRHKRSEIAENDPHEHLELARWCLNYKMNDHAREHLEEVLRLHPESREAAAMLANLDAQAERGQQPGMRPPEDSAVRTAATVAGDASPGVGPMPADIHRQAIQQAREAFGGHTAPVVFDLPPALAMKRAQEFDRGGVHRVLQQRCASCHHERSGSSFQLIQTQRPADNTREVVLFNLDATLRLIDPQDPTKSQLLASSLLPHKPSGKPILTGQNDRAFQVLSAWVRNIRSVSPAGGPAAAGDGQGFASIGAPSGGERFAGSRPEAAIASSRGDAPPTIPANPAGFAVGTTPPMEFPTEAVAPPSRLVTQGIPAAPAGMRATAGPPIPGVESLSTPTATAPPIAGAPPQAQAGAAPDMPVPAEEAIIPKTVAPTKPVKINNKSLDAFFRKKG